MKHINADQAWVFRKGFLEGLFQTKMDPGVTVNLPHDGMIGQETRADAPARHDMGYFVGEPTNYTKYIMIPQEWEGETVGVLIDGAMMNVAIELNGCKVGSQHYGYAPFFVDLTPFAAYGEENRLTINTNTSMYTNSRWYTGSGLYRGIELIHGPKLHIVTDGIYMYTKEVADGIAYLEGTIGVQNDTAETRLAEVTVSLTREGSDEVLHTAKRVIQIDPGKETEARMAMTLEDPALWDVDHPDLYRVHATIVEKGIFRTHLIPAEAPMRDEESALFGIRTITADPIRGLRINGKTVKLKGGCIHHDNGLLGTVSLYETEARKVRKLKEVGYNAIRTSHNPPSKALVEACDREGLYIFDEAFDMWGTAKRGGDYSQFFVSDWEKDLTTFIKRDRIHPSVIIWSTGNEIPERGGLNNGFTWATRLADTVRALDNSRPISNGICSFWSGLDDEMASGKDQSQNAADDTEDFVVKGTEPFTNGLDILGYNYMEDSYEKAHEMYPDRPILGSENFPIEIGFRWPMVERLPYVLGDFTWTAWDYIGEAGIGKVIYVDPEDPRAGMGPWILMPATTSPFPWRTANDADHDINGNLLPQGEYRSVVWGSTKTYLYSMAPETFGKTEIVSRWGFPYVNKNWNYENNLGDPVQLVVFTKAEEVEVIVNGISLGKKPVEKEGKFPNCVRFETTYAPGTVTAISYTAGVEVSRDQLETAGEPAALRLCPEKTVLKADGHDLVYVPVEIIDAEGRIVPDAAVALTATVEGSTVVAGSTAVEGSAVLAAFGSANPMTSEDYTEPTTVSYKGRAMAILRSGYEAGSVTLTVSAEGMKAEVTLEIQ